MRIRITPALVAISAAGLGSAALADPTPPAPGDAQWTHHLNDAIPALAMCMTSTITNPAYASDVWMIDDHHLGVRMVDTDGTRFDCKIDKNSKIEAWRAVKPTEHRPDEDFVRFYLGLKKPADLPCRSIEPAVMTMGTQFGWIARQTCPTAKPAAPATKP